MDLIVLDAGVLIAILDAHDAHHDAARQELATYRDRGDRLVIPASAYAEILVAAFRQSPETSATIDEFLDALPATVEPASREIGRRAAEFRARHGSRLRLPDALVAATGIVLNADRVLTTDARWPEVGVRVHVVGESAG
ncbi:MAG: type II toxin-antitoxin system VapC family toxin [Candidatus Limnocylindrales bacterium]